MWIYKWLTADETRLTTLSWTANLAIVRLVYLSAVILSAAFDRVRWTTKAMPLLPAGAWQRISFYQ
jgi:hypothetical protein